MKRRSLTLVLSSLLLAFTASSLTTPAASAQNAATDRGKTSRDKQSSAKGAQPPNMDCEKMAKDSKGSVSVESCRQMLAAMQAYQNAVSDPSASRPGDDKMSCDQIIAEVKQQQFTAPDKTKVAEAQQATDALMKKAAENQAEAEALARKQTAENLAATVVDQFLPNAVLAARAKEQQKEQDALNAKIEKETAPVAEHSIATTASLVGDIGQQAASNPRLAKLMQMASAKHCKQ
jgi:hypothetical protein